MTEKILMRRGGEISAIPREAWEGHLAQVPQHSATRLGFMSEAHHRVRYFVVRELPLQGAPIQPEAISQALDLTTTHVNTILDDLERNLFFLVRDAQGAVVWAFPVTATPTPHRLTFSTGEHLYGA
jgi:hypothetical protein